jgi:glycosyltransferase involved in cell wall biosynthesis
MGWIPTLYGVLTGWPHAAAAGHDICRQPASRVTIPKNDLPITLSIGIMAWNEEDSIGPMLSSLLGQSVFGLLAGQGGGCEIVCLANGCTDRTVAIAQEAFDRMERGNPVRGLRARVADIPEAGRNNAWNRFVHEFSARETQYICVMDADIIFDRPDTLELVLGELERNPHLGAASDCPIKSISGNARPSLRERLSLSASDMTGTIEGRLNGMLYCLRSAIARNFYQPRDLGATDDGFFKAAICTDFFRGPSDPSRVVSVRGATHLYEPYLSLRDVVNNQKRQMIGQTTVHVLIGYLMTLPERDRANLGATLRQLEARDPEWLRRLIDAHVAPPRRFWQLFPGILAFRWRRLARMRGIRKVTHFPAAAVGSAITLVACWQAMRFLRRGMSAYWPKTVRQAILPAEYLSSK